MLLAIRSTYHVAINRSSVRIKPSLFDAPADCSRFSPNALITRFASTINVAIVGSGPAGFYTTQKLLKEPRVNVDIFEKLPVPFGLVRYGVAPDHPEVKNVINSFTSVANSDRVNFFGNIQLGQDIKLEDLMDAYHAVVLCYGSAQDKMLDIEGEDSRNTISARNFVGWYNGVPEDKDLEIDLECDTACIIGQGNVALDCARILLQPANLDKTDITSYAQSVLRRSKIRRIYMIGRRGPIQSSFTIKELRELIKLNESGTKLEPVTIFSDHNVTQSNLANLSRPRRRLTELLHNLSANRESSATNSDLRTSQPRVECIFKFMSKPLRINADFKTGRVCQLELQRTAYNGASDFLDQEARPVSLDEYETIDCGLVIRSIGYKAVMIDPSLPRDNTKGAILNTNGRVQGFSGLYCSGWLATGATGVIAGTLNSSQVTAQSLLEDLRNESLLNLSRKKPGSKRIMNILAKSPKQVVHFNDWLKIDELERRLGALVGKDREKLVEVEEMLEVARGMSTKYVGTERKNANNFWK